MGALTKNKFLSSRRFVIESPSIEAYFPNSPPPSSRPSIWPDCRVPAGSSRGTDNALKGVKNYDAVYEVSK